MPKSESINKKSNAGRKPKFDYTNEDFLSSIELYAKKGFTDKEIAYAIGLSPQTFCEKKSEYAELSEVLARGRATITAAVRAKFFNMAMGLVKVKSETKRFVQERCSCMGQDKRCPNCGGIGWVTLTDKVVIQEITSELPPSLQAQSTILYHYDPDWKNVERKEEDDDDNDVDIDESKWITNAGN